MVECGANVSGGFFADPGYKEVPELWNLGYPLLEVEPDGTIVVSKLPDTGGVINRAICAEQMIYELHDPANYITPDVVVDFTEVELDEIGGVNLQELRIDYIGINALHGEASFPPKEPPYEVCLRFAGRAREKRDAVKLGNEVETLVGKDPASSSIPRKHVREVLAIYSCLIPRDAIKPEIIVTEVA